MGEKRVPVSISAILGRELDRYAEAAKTTRDLIAEIIISDFVDAVEAPDFAAFPPTVILSLRGILKKKVPKGAELVNLAAKIKQISRDKAA